MCKEWLRTVGHFEQGWGTGPWGYWSGSSVVRWRVTVMVTVTCGVFYQWLNRTVHEKLCCVSVVLITSTAPLDLNMSFHLGEERGISVSLKHSSVCCQHFLLFQAENNDQTLIYFSYPPSPGQRGLQPMIVIIDSCFICFYFSILNEIYASQSSQSPKWRLECFVWSNQQQPTTLKPYAFISQQHSTWNSKSPHSLKHPNERMFVIFVLVKHIFRRGGGAWGWSPCDLLNLTIFQWLKSINTSKRSTGKT